MQIVEFKYRECCTEKDLRIEDTNGDTLSVSAYRCQYILTPGRLAFCRFCGKEWVFAPESTSTTIWIHTNREVEPFYREELDECITHKRDKRVRTKEQWHKEKRQQFDALMKAADDFLTGAAYTPVQDMCELLAWLRQGRKALRVANWK